MRCSELKGNAAKQQEMSPTAQGAVVGAPAQRRHAPAAAMSRVDESRLWRRRLLTELQILEPTCFGNPNYPVDKFKIEQHDRDEHRRETRPMFRQSSGVCSKALERQPLGTGSYPMWFSCAPLRPMPASTSATSVPLSTLASAVPWSASAWKVRQIGKLRVNERNY
jgi:hypothetical protein